MVGSDFLGEATAESLTDKERTVSQGHCVATIQPSPVFLLREDKTSYAFSFSLSFSDLVVPLLG